MPLLPDSTLRRAAWAPSVLLAAMIAVGLLISFAEQPVVT